MKFLNLLFSKNKRRWISFLNEVESPIDRIRTSKWRFVVDNFLIKHNIDFDKYSANFNWNNGRLLMDQNPNDIHFCSESYRKYFATTTNEWKLTNRELGINDWFYYAYPDVAIWFEEHYEEIEIYCNSLGFYYSIDEPKYNLHVFEFVINSILSSG